MDLISHIEIGRIKLINFRLRSITQLALLHVSTKVRTPDTL